MEDKLKEEKQKNDADVEQVKLERLLDIARQLGEMYPDRTTDLTIHDFDIRNFDEDKWDIQAFWVSANKDTCLVAKPKPRIKGISLKLFD